MRKLDMDELRRKTVAEFKASEKIPLVIVLDNVRSMHNVGSIFRTADAFLLEEICLCGFTPRPPHRDIHKTALGSTETVDWTYYEKTLDALAALRARGYSLIAIEQVEKGIPLRDFQTLPESKTAVILGNEVSGVGEDTLAACDAAVEIPQAGMKHSLNVSVAAGIVIWELVRKRMIA